MLTAGTSPASTVCAEQRLEAGPVDVAVGGERQQHRGDAEDLRAPAAAAAHGVRLRSSRRRARGERLEPSSRPWRYCGARSAATAATSCDVPTAHARARPWRHGDGRARARRCGDPSGWRSGSAHEDGGAPRPAASSRRGRQWSSHPRATSRRRGRIPVRAPGRRSPRAPTASANPVSAARARGRWRCGGPARARAHRRRARCRPDARHRRPPESATPSTTSLSTAPARTWQCRSRGR